MTRTPIRLLAVVAAVLAAAFAAGCGGSDDSGRRLGLRDDGHRPRVQRGRRRVHRDGEGLLPRRGRQGQAAAVQHRRAVRRAARAAASSTRARAGSPPGCSTPSPAASGIKMVAAKSDVGSPSYTSLLVSKDLVDSGRYKDFSRPQGHEGGDPVAGHPAALRAVAVPREGRPVDQGRQDRAARLRRHGAGAGERLGRRGDRDRAVGDAGGALRRRGQGRGHATRCSRASRAPRSCSATASSRSTRRPPRRS